MRSIADGATITGSVTMVERIGDTVRRPMGYSSPAVHALLRHLERVGVGGAPRALGVDDEGREVLTYLQDESALRSWPPVLLSDWGIVTLANWLREYHRLVVRFVPLTDSQWMIPELRREPRQIVRHRDLGPWNSIWQRESLVGFIDWDKTEPGYPVQDVDQLVWYETGPIGPRRKSDYGFDPIPDVHHRFALVCYLFGMAVSDVAGVLAKLHTEDLYRMERFSAHRMEPWLSWKNQHGDELAEEVTWLKRNKGWFLSEVAA